MGAAVIVGGFSDTPSIGALHPARPLSEDFRRVVRCESKTCRLVQYKTQNGLCRRCHEPLEPEEDLALSKTPEPRLPPTQGEFHVHGDAQSLLATNVRDVRRARHLSQLQLATKMQVPRTYISKIENGKTIPTLGSLERLAEALQVKVQVLVKDANSRREEVVEAIFADPFLAEIASFLPRLNPLHRTLFLGAVRDKSAGGKMVC